MSLTEIFTAIGGVGGIVAIFKYMEANAENKVLAKQAEKTIAAKDAENAELKAENRQLKAENLQQDRVIAWLAGEEAGE